MSTAEAFDEVIRELGCATPVLEALCAKLQDHAAKDRVCFPEARAIYHATITQVALTVGLIQSMKLMTLERGRP